MKKPSFLIVCLLIIGTLLTACGNNSAIVCGNCADYVPNDSFFCPNCGTAFFQGSTATTGETTKPTGSTTPTETSTQPATTPATDDPTPQTSPVVQTPPVNTHTHSFSAATCLTPQTCACGATTGGLGAHSFQDYICIYCGIVDKQFTYQYLCNWIATYGSKQGNLYRIDMADGADMYSLVYDTSLGCAYASATLKIEDHYPFTCLWLDNYSYGTSVDGVTLEGSLDPHTFVKDSPLPISSYTGDERKLGLFTYTTRLALYDMLDWLDDYLYYNNVGISIADLGFTAY